MASLTRLTESLSFTSCFRLPIYETGRNQESQNLALHSIEKTDLQQPENRIIPYRYPPDSMAFEPAGDKRMEPGEQFALRKLELFLASVALANGEAPTFYYRQHSPMANGQLPAVSAQFNYIVT